MTKKDIETNMSHNNLLDLMMMGAAVFILIGLAYLQLLHYIRAVHYIKYGLAGGFTAFLMYVILAPIFRK